jgi:Putative peptidoglycan binding domain
LRWNAAFPQAYSFKVFVLTACLVLALMGAAAAEASRESGPPISGHPRQRNHTPVELSKVRHAAASARHQVRAVAARARSRRGAKSARAPRGQQVITSERATQIQSALIRDHYLDGEASGVWDQRTRDAMTRYQAENGWQTKITPDSRALIKLGLGPRNDGLLNPDSAALASPRELGAERDIPGGH